MPHCEISGRAQMSKTIIAVKHFALGGRKSLETGTILLFNRACVQGNTARGFGRIAKILRNTSTSNYCGKSAFSISFLPTRNN